MVRHGHIRGLPSYFFSFCAEFQAEVPLPQQA
jgi:hypothetical protein